LVKRLDEMRKQMNLETMEDLEKAARRRALRMRNSSRTMRNQIITQRVIGQEVGSKLAMNKDDEKKFYEQHRARWSTRSRFA
jgi:peptidyl-prolyl cis-trans isomerase SurA